MQVLLQFIISSTDDIYLNMISKTSVGKSIMFVSILNFSEMKFKKLVYRISNSAVVYAFNAIKWYFCTIKLFGFLE